MNALEEYLATRWSSYDGEDELKGLSPFGFKDDAPLNIKNFPVEQLDWASDFALSCGNPIQNINKRHSSYGLKHLAERRAKRLSNNEINYISNGALILAMVDAGFRFVRDGDSPNVCFNVSERAIKRMTQQYNKF